MLQVKKKKKSTTGWVATGAQRRNTKGWHPSQKGKKEGTTGNTFLKILLKVLKNLTKLPAGTEKHGVVSNQEIIWQKCLENSL